MIKEKHIVNGIYGGHQLARYVDVYELSAVDCYATQYSGYRGTEVTLVDNPPAGYNFSHWDITGATLTGNNFIMNNDVTARAAYTHDPSAVYYTHANNLICTSREQQQLNINKALTSYNYVSFGFNITATTSNNAMWAWDFNINFNTGSWNARNHYNLNVYDTYGPVRNGQNFTGVYSGVKSKVIDNQTLYYAVPGTTKYKFVYDRSANICSAFMKDIKLWQHVDPLTFQVTTGGIPLAYLGYGTIANGVTSLDNFKLISENYSNLTANSFYLAGFDDLSAAVNY